MPWRADRAATVALLCVTLASCAGSDRPRRAGGSGYRPVTDLPVKIGPAYRVGGITYQPRDDRGYDQTGLASWYGSESGNRTANGERFRPSGISAAHKTLPLPSYVEVTVLATGRTILLRVNDRGPFREGRIIDLSQGAAAALGLLRSGPAPVRVRRVEPPETDRVALRAGRAASPRPDAAPRVATLPRTVIPAPERQVPASAARPRLLLDLPAPETNAATIGWYVQVGTFTDRARADSLMPGLATIGPAGVSQSRSLWRARIGPYDEVGALAALAQARARGYQDAVLVRPETTP